MSAEPEAQERILVVDDVAANVRLLEAILGPRGYELISASSGEEALARLSAYARDVEQLRVAVAHGTALAVPVEKAEQALVGKFTQVRPRQRCQVRIGQMGEHEHRGIIARGSPLLPSPACGGG